MLNMNLQERMSAAMKHAKISQAELARRAGVSRGTVSLWVNGPTQTIDGHNLVRAAEVLGVTAKWLSEERGPMLAEATRAAGEHEARQEVAAYGETDGIAYAMALQDAVRAIASRAGVDLQTLITDTDDARLQIAKALHTRKKSTSMPSTGREYDVNPSRPVTNPLRIEK